MPYRVTKPFNTSEGGQIVYHPVGEDLDSIEGCEHLVGTHLVETASGKTEKAPKMETIVDAPVEAPPVILEDAKPPEV